MKFTHVLFLMFFSLTTVAFAASKKRFPLLVKDDQNKTVIFQTKMKAMNISGEIHYVRYYISEVKKNKKFSYGIATYTCKNTKCEPTQFLHIRFYETCSGFDLRGTPNCDQASEMNRSSERRDHHLDSSSQYPQDEGEWYKYEDWQNNPTKQKDLYDEPERDQNSNYIDGLDDGRYYP